MTRAALVAAVAVAAVVVAVAPAARAQPVEIVELVARPTVFRVVRAKPEALSAAIAAAIAGLVFDAPAYGLRIDGPPYARYRSRGDTRDPTFVVEVGVPLARPAARELARGVAAGTLPGGSAAVMVHRGRHDQLPRAHARLDAWLARSGHRAAGPRWEELETDPFTTPDPAAQRTRIVAPLARR